MTPLQPKFTITNRMTAAITLIERVRGFLEAARLSDDWVRDMGNQALIKEAHHTTHIEGTRLTLDQAKRLWNGRAMVGGLWCQILNCELHSSLFTIQHNDIIFPLGKSAS